MSRNSTHEEALGRPFGSALGPILLLTSIFFCVFFARVLLAPYLPAVEREFGLTHTRSGWLFFTISLGYSVSLFFSGFLAKRIGHRGTIIVSIAAIGVGLLLVSTADTYPGLQISLLLMGGATGLYLPSGIATITATAAPKDWGKGLSIHELAPNLSFIAAPALAGLLEGVVSWRELFGGLGAAALIMAVVFARFGPNHRARGESPMPTVLAGLVRRREFWVLTLLFALAISVSFASFSMVPLFLVSARGFDEATANHLVAASRLAGPFMALAAGFIVDRFGARKTAMSALVFSGLFCILLGLVRGWSLWGVVILQPLLSVFLFPSGLTVLSRVFHSEVRNVAISIIIPIALVLGNGAMPIMLGWFGDRDAFGWGFVVLGAVSLFGVVQLRTLPGEDSSGQTDETPSGSGS
jgi:NNP family nitrate/nitrite transporter-like MFS transporter